MTARAAASAAALLGALLHIGCASDTRYGGSAGIAGAGGSLVAGDGGDSGGSGGTAGSGGQAGATGVGGTGTGGMAGATGGSSAGGGPGGGAGGIGGGTGGTGGSQTGGRGGATAGTGGGAAGGAGGKAGAGGGASTSLKLEYATTSPTATIFGVRITNSGPTTPLISVIRARYYFSDDSTNKMNGATLDSATWHLAGGGDVDVRASGGCAVISTFPAAPAFSYADIGCSLSSPLNANDTLTFTVHFDPTTQAAANDYSYLATSGTFQPNGRMLLLHNGLIISGTPPF